MSEPTDTPIAGNVPSDPSAPSQEPPVEPAAEPHAPEEPRAERDDRYLLFTPNFKRWFAIPRDRDLAEGDMDVVRLAGGRRRIDPAALVEFEVSAEEARVLFRQRVQGLAHDTVERGGEVVKGAVSRVPKPDREKVRQGVAELLGVAPEQLGEPDVLFTHLRERASGLGRKVREEVVPPPEKREAVRKAVDGLVGSVRKEGVEVVDELGRVSDRVEELLRSPGVEQRVRDAAGLFRTAADRLRSALGAERPHEEPPSETHVAADPGTVAPADGAAPGDDAGTEPAEEAREVR